MKKRIYLFLLVVASLAMILIGCGNNNSSNTTDTDVNAEKKEPVTESESVMELETESVTEIETESISVMESQTEETEDTRVAKETGEFILNIHFQGDSKKEDLWDGYENIISIRLFDNNNTKILDEKLPASDEVMSSLSNALSEQITFNDVKAFFEEHESAAIETLINHKPFEIDVKNDLDETLNFTYNGDEMQFHIDEAEASIIINGYDTSEYDESDFFTEGCIIWNLTDEKEYHMQAGGVEYMIKGTYNNYGSADEE